MGSPATKSCAAVGTAKSAVARTARTTRRLAEWIGVAYIVKDFSVLYRVSIELRLLRPRIVSVASRLSEANTEFPRSAQRRGQPGFQTVLSTSTTSQTRQGWGPNLADLDDDGDQDIVCHGVAVMNLVAVKAHPGVVLENQGGSASISDDITPFRSEYPMVSQLTVWTGIGSRMWLPP